ncbi:endolytic transglycosylase MltG [Sporosarcina ureilytica]|uniref:Endolytic murein transglycosylase n=1 Tax=Sporosarcina ureilytica TaxID=298596 RepID=A0A1D8JGX1_9BACL|nr:endolytic transglycosylase MltG [Sporosarcina ureilytica]AOV07934.1 hypothetical protein BI350_10560 [Sporosarcina ureilytica]
MDKGSKKEVMFERMREKKKEVKIVRKIVFGIALGILVIGLIGGLFTYNYISKGLKAYDPNSEELIEVNIPIGSGLNNISKILEEKGIVKSARLFKYYAKFNNESKFQAGTYELSKSMTPDELIKSLKTGKVYREPVFTLTVPEGLTLKEVASIVENRTNVSAEDFLAYVNDKENIEFLMGKYPHLITEEVFGEQIKFPLEGYLFPATYPFYEENPSVEMIVDSMLEATEANILPFLDYLEKKDKSVHWLLTFASLLEKEATAQADRETIASVFYNRLAIDMPLQTDPTVAYAHGEHLSRTYYKDLEIDDPYNTYKYAGIPPGPIAGAGKSSIEAVVDPSQTKYLYFLAGKDGMNHFAVTYEEHLSNRAKYID